MSAGPRPPIPGECGAGQPLAAIVLADDEALVLPSCVVFLETAGYRVIEVSNDRAAIEACRGHRPDLAVLDYRMPELDGLSAAANGSGTTPFIIVSSDPIERAAREAGAHGFCAKPVACSALLSLIQQISHCTMAQS